jgi:hypothetical protein
MPTDAPRPAPSDPSDPPDTADTADTNRPEPATARLAGRIAAALGVPACVVLALAYFDLAGQAGEQATPLQVYGPVFFALMVYVNFAAAFALPRGPLWAAWAFIALNAALIPWAAWLAAAVVF